MIFYDANPITLRGKLYVLSLVLFVITGFFLLPYASITLQNISYRQFALTHDSGKATLAVIWFAAFVQVWFFVKNNKSLQLLWFFMGLFICVHALYLWVSVYQTFPQNALQNLATKLGAKAEVLPGLYGVFVAGLALILFSWRKMKRP